MTAQDTTSEPHPPPQAPQSLMRRVVSFAAVLALVYFAVAYLFLPMAWRVYVRRHSALREIPGITHTRSGIPGDPLNIALVGSEEQVKRAMERAGWYAADRLSVRSSLEIAEGTVFGRAYDEAPVSNLYLYGRKEDMAFEKPVGSNPRKRHHVRFWLSDKTEDGRPVWIGSATYDERVGFSGTTVQITHHIDADVDAERNDLLSDLQKTGDLSDTYSVNGFHTTLQGHNGGGDRWYTDGALGVGVIAEK